MCFKNNSSSLHWLILGFLYAFFVQWSIFAKDPVFQLNHKCLQLYGLFIYQKCEMRGFFLSAFLLNKILFWLSVTHHVLELHNCPKNSKNCSIKSPLELFWLTMISLFESRIIQWRLLYLPKYMVCGRNKINDLQEKSKQKFVVVILFNIYQSEARHFCNPYFLFPLFPLSLFLSPPP